MPKRNITEMIKNDRVMDYFQPYFALPNKKQKVKACEIPVYDLIYTAYEIKMLLDSIIKKKICKSAVRLKMTFVI